MLVGMEQIELAKRSRVAVGTIRRMEYFEGEIGARTTTLSKAKATLENAGVEFLNDGRPGVRLREEPGRSRLACAPAGRSGVRGCGLLVGGVGLEDEVPDAVLRRRVDDGTQEREAAPLAVDTVLTGREGHVPAAGAPTLPDREPNQP